MSRRRDGGSESHASLRTPRTARPATSALRALREVTAGSNRPRSNARPRTGANAPCYRPSVRRCSALLASLAALLASSAARADDPPPTGAPPAPADPRDVFGLGKKPVAPPPTCDDGRTFGCATAQDPFDEVSPFSLRSWLSADYLLRLPVADARHDAAAAFALGAHRDDAGLSFIGATSLENLWTIEGAPAESLRTGNVETRIPLTFLDSLLILAGGYSARDRASTGGTIDARLRRGGRRHELDAHAWLTLYSAADRTRPIARSTYQLRRISFTPDSEVTASVVGTGPLPRIAGGRAWYAAGISPNLGRTGVRWRAARLTDVDQDGLPDGLPGVVAVQPITDTEETVTDYSVAGMARAGWSRGRHELELSLVGNAAGDAVFFANATRQAAGVDRRFWIGDAIASWRATWPDTRLHARASWHRSMRYESAHDPAAASIRQLQTAYVPTKLPDDPDLAALCDDTAADDPFPEIPNCPIPFGFFISGGAGRLTDSAGDRPQLSADIAHRVGAHVVRAGALLEDSRLVETARFTGGELVRSLFDGHLDHQRFYSECEADPAKPCTYVDRSELAYRSRYTAAYAEDTFQLAPNIRVDGGLRWELMWVGPYLHFSRQLAPRLGLAWDVLGNGSSRLFAGMGRSFLMLPPGIGPTIIGRDKSVRDIESPFGVDRNLDPGGIFIPAPGIRPAAQDEATAGLEVGRPGTARAAVWVAARSLRRGYETVLANPDTLELQFDNPGRAAGATPASRSTTLVAVEVATDPTAKTVVRAGYLYGRTVGSWAGPVDPRQGQALYEGTDWDIESANYVGRLPTDPGHRAFVEGLRRGRVGPVELAVSTRLTVGSGRPRNVLGDSDLGIVYLLPRGSAGRGPAISQANVRLLARWRGFDLTLDVFNVFDRQTATNLDEIYAGSTVRPIRGGTEADLVFLKTETGGDPVRRSGYRLPFAFQAPIAGTLGIHRAF